METETGGPLGGGRLSYLFMKARDFPRMLSFYRETLGLEVEYLEEDRCVFFRLDGGGPLIAIYAGRETEVTEGNHWFVAIDVEDIESAARRLKERGVQIGDIEDVPNGRAAICMDPEGNTLLVRGAVPGAGGGYVLIRKTSASAPRGRGSPSPRRP